MRVPMFFDSPRRRTAERAVDMCSHRPAKVAACIAALLLPLALQAQESPLAALSWLAGCWASETGEAGSGEQWMPPAGGTMLGMARTVKSGRTVAHEFLQLRLNADGKLVYIALPSNQRETSFVASSVGETAATFENPQHDFPQRIVYRLLPGDRLLARIEGTRGGQLRGIDFPMRRVACGGLPR